MNDDENISEADESSPDKEDAPRATSGLINGGVRMITEGSENVLREVEPFKNEIKRILGVPSVKRAFTLGTELFSAMAPFFEKPTWWNAGAGLFSMGKTLVQDNEVFREDYFSGDEWTEPYSADFRLNVLQLLQRFPYEKIKTADEDTFVRVCVLPNGVKAGWSYTGRLNLVNNLYIETERLEDGKEYIKQQLWEQFKGKSLVMRRNDRMIISEGDTRIIFEVDDAFESKTSKRAIDYARYLKKPLEAGVPRSVMFYGPPGTGKSTLARTIVDLMKLRSFRIRIADLGRLDNSTLFEAVKIFEPDAVILDDFDRTGQQAQLLETLEFFQQKVKLVIVTVNNKKKLDPALMRPGRLDEMMLVDKMDEDVVRSVLGEYADGYEHVKDWPIAFINEYVVRRTYLSASEAADGVKELAQRVKDLNHYRDSEDAGLSKMLQLLTSAQVSGKAPKAIRKHKTNAEASALLDDMLNGIDKEDEADSG